MNTWMMGGFFALLFILVSTGLFFFVVTRGALVVRGNFRQVSRPGFTHTFNPRCCQNDSTLTVIFPDSTGATRVTFDEPSNSWLPRVLITSGYGNGAVVFDSATTIQGRLDATDAFAGIEATYLTVTDSVNTQARSWRSTSR